MSSEAARRSKRNASQDKPDASAKGKKEAVKSDGSLKKTDPASNVLELDMQKTKEVMVDASAYQVVFYMKHFRVTDIIVKLDNRTLIIDACHREHADEHGLISRSVVRKEKIPENVKLETLCSAFTTNGFLVIHAECNKIKSEQK